jgi:hypothetical protein
MGQETGMGQPAIEVRGLRKSSGAKEAVAGIAAQDYASYQVLAVFGSVGATALAASPVIIATVLTSADPASVRMPALLLFATAYGLALAMASPRIAAGAAGGRLPELCQVAIRSKL